MGVIKRSAGAAYGCEAFSESLSYIRTGSILIGLSFATDS